MKTAAVLDMVSRRHGGYIPGITEQAVGLALSDCERVVTMKRPL